MNFKKTTLPNGLRVITVPVKDNPAVMVLVVVETGSKYEDQSENGLSHFLEHMCFKGTTKRLKASDIAIELDGLGAENNAFTGTELTGYYAKAAKKHFHKLFDIVSDIYLNQTLPAEDIEKERGVILEEISMYEDVPQRQVWNVLYKLLYGDTPAGRTIIGPRENIKKFSREDFVNYRNKHYVAKKTIVIVSGDVSEKEVLNEVKKHFSNISEKKKVSKLPVKESQKSPGLSIYKKKTEQTHMILAFRTVGAKSKESVVLAMLAEILGQGMSSRLFIKMREEMGACYYIRATHDQATDHGSLNISTGINASRTKEVLGALLGECKKMSQELVSEAELKKAKEHAIGHLYMGLETTSSLAEFYAEQEVSSGKPKNPKEIEKLIRGVSAKDILDIAKRIFKDSNVNLAIVGDVSDEAGVRKTLSFK